MGSVVKLFLANGLGWLRTSRDFETSFAWLKALATTFQPISVEGGLAGQATSPALALNSFFG